MGDKRTKIIGELDPNKKQCCYCKTYLDVDEFNIFGDTVPKFTSDMCPKCRAEGMSCGPPINLNESNT